jgi:hypothetical protein
VRSGASKVYKERASSRSLPASASVRPVSFMPGFTHRLSESHVNNRIRALALVAMGRGAHPNVGVRMEHPALWQRRRFSPPALFEVEGAARIPLRQPQHGPRQHRDCGGGIAESPAALPETHPIATSTAMPVADVQPASVALPAGGVGIAKGGRAAPQIVRHSDHCLRRRSRPPNPRSSSFLPASSSMGCVTTGRPGTTVAPRPSPRT